MVSHTLVFVYYHDTVLVLVPITCHSRSCMSSTTLIVIFLVSFTGLSLKNHQCYESFLLGVTICTKLFVSASFGSDFKFLNCSYYVLVYVYGNRHKTKQTK